MFARLVTFMFALMLPVLVPPAEAATDAEIARLLDALAAEELFAQVRREGVESAVRFGEETFPGRADAGWRRRAESIYRLDLLRRVFEPPFSDELRRADIAPLIAFFESDAGRYIVDLELETRRIMADEALERAAAQRWRALPETDAARAALIGEYIAENDLIENNVVGAMNAAFAFYSGLVDGGGFEMAEDQIVSDVWAREEEIRADTAGWIGGYCALAYGDVPLEDLEEYVELSRSPEGRALNRAIFAGFDALFDEMSYAVGRAASARMVSEEL